MEEFIPLIVGIIWLLYTFYNKGQKNKQRKRPAEQGNSPESKPSFLEQLFASEDIVKDEYDQEVDEEEPVFEPVVVRKPVYQKENVKPFLRAELSQFTEEGQSHFSEFENDHDEKNGIINIPSDLVENIRDFDIKEAVVYSEILNAPYIDYK